MAKKNNHISYLDSKKYLILGGARSGKSQYAESLLIKKIELKANLENHTKTVKYVATAEALDFEMKERIQQHQLNRENYTHVVNWELIEEPIELGQLIATFGKQDVVLIDCLTVWLNNCLYHKVWPQQKLRLMESIQQTESTIVMVSNEVGQGIIPMGKLSRDFVDESGRLHQELAKICDHVDFITAGITQHLK